MDVALKTADFFVQQQYPALHEKFTGQLQSSTAIGSAPFEQDYTLSGWNASDYPIHSSVLGQETLKHFVTVKKVPIPAELRGQFENVQASVITGVFPEIRRAYVTRDSDLYLWDYTTGKDLVIYDYLCESILSVALFRPTPGLCQTNGTLFMALSGSRDGRLFMGGSDGCLWELQYQAEAGWFSRRCKTVNQSASLISYFTHFISSALYVVDSIVEIRIDCQRGILYTLTERGTIDCYDLGEPGKDQGHKKISRVATLTASAIQAKAQSVGGEKVNKNDVALVTSLCVISAHEDPRVHLLAVTERGVRLYFSTVVPHQYIQPVTPNSPPTPRNAPTCLHLMHVRLAPGYSSSDPSRRPDNVVMSVFSRGTFLMGTCPVTDPHSTKADGGTTLSPQHQSLSSSFSHRPSQLWLFTPHLFPTGQEIKEVFDIINIEGRDWTVAEEPDDRPPPTDPNRPFASLVVTQLTEPARKFVLFTPQATALIQQQRPTDQLRDLLIESKGADSESVLAFLQLLPSVEACYCSLILACDTRNPQLSQWANHADPPGGSGGLRRGPAGAFSPTGFSDGSVVAGGGFSPFPAQRRFIPNSSPHSPFQQPPASVSFSSAHTSTPVRQGYDPQQGQFVQSTTFPDKPPSPLAAFADQGNAPGNAFSAKHNALYLYYARLLRPLWDARIVAGSQEEMVINASPGELGSIMEYLQLLINFMQREIFSSLTTLEALGVAAGAQPLSPAAQETQSLQALADLALFTKEVLGLWQILSTHQFHLVVQNLSPPDMKRNIFLARYRDLIEAGKAVPLALIRALISCYLSHAAVVSAISARLRSVCPGIFLDEDANTRSRMLNDLRPVDLNLNQAQQLCASGAYSGLVDLVLEAAQAKDPRNLALGFHREGAQTVGDDITREAFYKRQECYKVLLEAIKRRIRGIWLWVFTEKAPRHLIAQGDSINQDQVSSSGDTGHLTPMQAKEYAVVMMNRMLESKDELLHVALYGLLIEYKLDHVLMHVRSPFMKSYLKQSLNGNSVTARARLDVLWKIYDRDGKHRSAAKVLVRLAEMRCSEIDLTARLMYLNNAIDCLKQSHGHNTKKKKEFLHRLEEKKNVLRVQQMIYEYLSRMSQSDEVKGALTRLSSELYTVEELYDTFAIPFELFECQLALIHVARYKDPKTVERLWIHVLEKELRLSQGQPSTDRIALLRNKLQDIGTMFRIPLAYFPVEVLLPNLERLSEDEGLSREDPAWVWKVFYSLKVPLADIVPIYESLTTSGLGSQSTSQTLRSILSLFEAFVNDPSMEDYEPRRLTIGKILKCLPTYIIYLSNLPLPHPSMTDLLPRFRDVNNRLGGIRI
ncbi:unnamed protein product [Cyprideis torosa]|uniref:Uncharacterized protein n=1 Tax=Cyprideis torosa TaxID=163714 RepID=A0A7R8ZRG0_9CRUS|nr:unnamed protein product [Cyprideis torosa]CAG0892962.1 unnamed protein product [Cyprideis torosa]